MFRLSFSVAKVWGIPIRVHISLLILLVWMGVSDFHEGAPLLPGLALEFLLLLSITLHELGHSFFAQRYGCRVREITLTLIGGIAQMVRIPTVPRQELIMAAAGPAVSFMLGGLFLIAAKYVPLFAGDQWLFSIPYVFSKPCSFLGFVGCTNFVFGGFNLLPGFPMDGGRILRAALARRRGRVEATRQAAQYGRWVATAFGLIGVYNHWDWILIGIAFFIHSAANKELLYVLAESGAAQGPFRTGNAASVDQVVIGPAPYEKGPGSESDVYRGR